jgi:hypothetical protein
VGQHLGGLPVLPVQRLQNLVGHSRWPLTNLRSSDRYSGMLPITRRRPWATSRPGICSTALLSSCAASGAAAPAAGSRLGRDPAQQHAAQFLGLDRLGDGRPCRAGSARGRWRAPLAVMATMGSALMLFAAADFTRGGDAVHDRHLHVHQHQVVGVVGHLVERDLAIAGDVHHQAGQAQNARGHLLIEIVVLTSSHAHRAAG